MTSAINPSTINITYPVAGQDNNSQGFRDNFAAIQANFTTAENEITQLQRSAILSSDLATGLVPQTNNLNGSTLFNGLTNKLGKTYYAVSGANTTQNISLNNGSVQQFTLSSSVQFNFTDWPTTSDTYSSILLIFGSDTSGVYYPIFGAESSTLRYDANFPINPSTGSYGFNLGGESLATTTDSSGLVSGPVIIPDVAGSGYTGVATVSFTSPSLTGGVTPTARATYKVVSASLGTVTGTVTATNSTGNLITLNTVTGLSVGYSITFNTPTGAMSGNNIGTSTTYYIQSISGNNITVSTVLTGGQLLAVNTVLTDSMNFVSQPSNANAGTGFVTGDIIALNSNTNVQLSVTASGGAITGTTVINGGPLSVPVTGVSSFTALTGVGSGARLLIKCGIGPIRITNVGDGYTSTAPTVTVSAPGTVGGVTASFNPGTVTLTSGTATNVKIVEAFSYDAGTTIHLRYLGEY
jgi:hypothetical protein